MARKWMRILGYLALVLMVAVISAITATLVTRRVIDQHMVPFEVSQTAGTDRQTVSLAPVLIRQTISSSGTIEEDGDGFVFSGRVTPIESEYQLLDPPAAVTVTLYGGPGRFDCAWKGLVRTEFGMRAQCAIPDDIRVAAGLSGGMVIALDDGVDTQGLPISAVFGSTGTGQVVLLKEDGTTEPRDVELGVNDGINVEILSGLQPDDAVLLYPTQGDFPHDQ